MEVSMSQAALSAVLSVLLGIALGVFYDAIRFARVVLGVSVQSPFKKERFSAKAVLGYVFVCVTDLAFFAVAAVLFCVFFYLTGDGRMRWYGLVGAFLGFLLYYNTVGRLFINTVTYLISLIKRGVRFLLRPVLAVCRLAKKICMRIFDMPIVKAQIKRYNDYITKRKKNAAAKKRRRKAKKSGYCINGGTHG